jgi:hypothetical protein
MKAYTEYSSVRFKQSAVTELLTVEGVPADEKQVELHEPETKRRPVKYHGKFSTAGGVKT